MASDRPPPRIRCLRGAGITPWLADVARLRIAVFRDWPYLYDGDADYEQGYLAAYARSPDSVFVLALDDDDVVIGAATGLPLADDTPEFRLPFIAAGMPVDEVFYFGESVLLPAYRGLGLGHRFFDEREAHARALGRFRWTAFCSVERDPRDPRRPPGYRPNDVFWGKRGYVRQPGMACRLAWKEISEENASEKSLGFWLREWSPSPGAR